MKIKDVPTMPVMIVRTTHTTVIQLTRVPCVGEIIYQHPSPTA